MFYELRALSHKGVDAVRVIPRDRGIGTVGVVVAASDGAPKQALLDEIQQDLDSVREIAVDVQVMAPELQSVDVTVKLWPKQKTSFADASAAVQTALRAFFTGSLLGRAVYRAQLGKAVLDTGMVENYQIVEPAADIVENARVLPQLGTLTILEGEE